MDYYAVIGNPVNHSKSPLIHHLFAQQTKQNLTYTAVLVALDNLSAALTSLQSQGFKGLNITQPFKQQAVSLVDNLSPRASRAKAINTLVFREDGSRFGDNTDGIGFVRDIQVNRRVTLQGKRILILGAGGAARGIIEAICNEKPETLVVANRSVSKVIALANDFPSICPSSLANLGNDSFDIIINSTSASSSEIVSMLPATL
jgi:shikimate dehydrogenase